MDYMGILTSAAKNIWKDKVIYAFQLVFMSIVPLLSLLVMGVFVASLDMQHPERMSSMFDHPFDSQNLPILVAMGAGYFVLMLFYFFAPRLAMLAR